MVKCCTINLNMQKNGGQFKLSSVQYKIFIGATATLQLIKVVRFRLQNRKLVQLRNWHHLRQAAHK